MARHDEEREKRLAEALRENLRRRKAQARGEGGGSLPAQPRGDEQGDQAEPGGGDGA
jgi:hypothetical protein